MSSSSRCPVTSAMPLAVAATGALLMWLWKHRDEEKPIYLDWNGTTPVYPAVVKAMMPYLTDHFGNPSSGHWAGTEPRRAVENARRQILELLSSSSASPSGHTESTSKEQQLDSIWFTSCGTESDNLAIELALRKSACSENQNETRKTLPHIVTCNVEHPAIEKYLQHLEREHRCRVTHVPVQPDGRVKAEDVTSACNSDTCLVTLMLANNESGALQPVKEVSEYCRSVGILMHTDAAQAAGKVSVALEDLGHPDMVTIVGHKLGAPKGVACLYVRPGCLPEESIGSRDAGGVLLVGGGQEHGRRGGTENVPYIVGLGEAASIAARDWKSNSAKMEGLRSRLLENLSRELVVRTNGPMDPSQRLPNTLSVGLKGIHSGELLAKIGDRVAASAGSACHSDDAVSAVLEAMRVPREYARGTLRLSVGPATTTKEIDEASDLIETTAKNLLQLEK